MELSKIRSWFLESKGFDKGLIVFLLLGGLLVFGSLFQTIVRDSRVEVEYLPANGKSEDTMIWVDVGGSVMKPDVYQLVTGSRIKDALAAAGGLSLMADREFVTKNINLAMELKDGDKIYIPSLNTNAERGYFEASIGSEKVAVNTASVSKLTTLWGVGEAKAELIVKNRPYSNLQELVSRKVISQNVLDRNMPLLDLY